MFLFVAPFISFFYDIYLFCYSVLLYSPSLVFFFSIIISKKYILSIKQIVVLPFLFNSLFPDSICLAIQWSSNYFFFWHTPELSLSSFWSKLSFLFFGLSRSLIDILYFPLAFAASKHFLPSNILSLPVCHLEESAFFFTFQLFFLFIIVTWYYVFVLPVSVNANYFFLP